MCCCNVAIPHGNQRSTSHAQTVLPAGLLRKKQRVHITCLTWSSAVAQRKNYSRRKATEALSILHLPNLSHVHLPNSRTTVIIQKVRECAAAVVRMNWLTCALDRFLHLCGMINRINDLAAPGICILTDRDGGGESVTDWRNFKWQKVLYDRNKISHVVVAIEIADPPKLEDSLPNRVKMTYHRIIIRDINVPVGVRIAAFRSDVLNTRWSTSSRSASMSVSKSNLESPDPRLANNRSISDPETV